MRVISFVFLLPGLVLSCFCSMCSSVYYMHSCNHIYINLHFICIIYVCLLLVSSLYLCQSTAVVVGWMLNVPTTCECISGTDLLRQFYVLPH